MNIIVGNAWPYANGPLHLGRIAVLLPGDIIARYHRLMGDEVVFLSGTDCHGTPVTMKAKEEGITPLEATIKYHDEFKRCFDSLGFSFDVFEKTHSDYHEEKVKKFILELYNNGYIYEKEIEQTYCENCHEFLSDRYIEGKCPHCGEIVSGDQCESCLEIIDSEELLDKRCKLCGNETILKETKHLFFSLSSFENDVRRLLIRQKGWRENAQKIVKRYLDEGLRDRAVTRDFNWGVDVPLEGYDDKKIFVWIEAVMGYLTASMKCLEERNEDWKEYWQGEDSRVYFVHGKDNIPFHTVIFPAILAGIGIKNPNLRVISSEYMKLEGKNFSSVKNWAIWGDYIVDNYDVDEFRYYLALNSPEVKDTDFTWRDFINVVNRDLVNSLSNFINKTIDFINKNYDSKIPNGIISNDFKNEILNLYFDVGDNIEEGKFKNAILDIMSYVKKMNKYLEDELLKIKLQKSNKEIKNKIYECVQVIANLSNLLEPFMPDTCKKIRNSLDLEEPIWSYIEKKSEEVLSLEILFKKLDKKRAFEEVKRLKEERN
ncbi:methionine--tRNA ligase [Clostridium tertium]|jgi:methionyl-tRNA synthetase|uniref:Methionine--tRNA ligase n=2 Tax=Clostridium tertium TaxID=1559 RepID=A0A9X3XH76_9CLOT|nr:MULTISPECIES: methionine--tRNA ligase [Clostridium]EJZ50412.1 methionine-tRNA ligase [Clostridium sp. 7_2_43FAA]MBP1867992.1 methionyl-tRNA synthetase [Clostridium tertium]MBU6136394.1 methionine--tRNA ligase [Clostridium tertium]MDB1940268.1 methionine--tRNA ligase [Clostridium tertium]MDB1948514.1 methionine--tRNA ligase [Clostridium tertium]